MNTTIDIQLNFTINPLNIKILPYTKFSQWNILHMLKYKKKIYNLTTRSLLIKSQLIISAICGGNSQHMKAGDSSEFYYLTVLYCTPPNCNVICSMYIPCLLLTDKFCLCEVQIIEPKAEAKGKVNCQVNRS